MSYEEEFDKIVRQKASEAEYPFDEGNWEKTSRLIDAERTATRKVFWKKLYLPGAVVIGLGTAGVIAFSYFSHPATVVVADKHSDIKTQPVIASASTQDSKENLNAPGIENKVVSANKEESTNTDMQQTQLASTDTKKSASKVAHTLETAQQAAPDKISNPEEKAAPHVQASALGLSQASEDHVTHASSKAPDLTANPGKMNASPVTTGSGNQASGTLPIEPVVKASDDASNNDRKILEPLKSSPTETSDDAQIEQAEQLTAHFGALPYEMFDNELRAVQFTILQRYDEDYYSKKARTHYMNVEAGGNYILGWNTANGKDGSGFNWFGGINYGYYICNKTSIGIGAQVYNISNIRQAFYSTSTKLYDFGYSNTYTVVTSNDLYYVAVPLKFTYHMNQSNQLGLGFNAGYLMTASNRIETYSIMTEGKERTDAPSVANKGVYEGTRSWNFGASAFYKVNFTPRIAVNAEVMYGLTDIFKNTTNITNAEKPLGFRLSLQYTLFDK